MEIRESLIPRIQYDNIIDYEPVKNPDAIKLIYFNSDLYSDGQFTTHTVWRSDVDFKKLDSCIKENIKEIKKKSLVFLWPAVFFINCLIPLFVSDIFKIPYEGLFSSIHIVSVCIPGLVSCAFAAELAQRRRHLYVLDRLRFAEKHREKINKMYEDAKLLSFNTDMFNPYNNRNYPLSKEYFLMNESKINYFVLEKRLKKVIKDNEEDISYQKELLSKRRKIELPKEETKEIVREEVQEENINILDELRDIKEKYTFNPDLSNTTEEVKPYIKQ